MRFETKNLNKEDQFNFRSDTYAWFVVAMLCFATIISFIDRQIINLLVEPIKRDLNISDTGISLLQGFAFAIFYSFVAIPLGRLADQKNRINIIAIGVLVWSFASMLCGIAKLFWQLFLARMFVGIGEATLSPAGFSLLSDYFPRKSLTRAISIFTASSFLGSGIALLIGAFVIQSLTAVGSINLGVLGMVKPWQMSFIIVSAPGIIFALIIWLSIREPPRIPDKNNKIEEMNTIKDSWLYLLDNKKVLFPVIFGFTLLATMMFSISAWIPSFYIRTYETSASEIGSIFGIYLVFIGSAGVISGGFFSDWLKNKGHSDSNLRVGLISSLIAVPFIVSFPLMESKLLSLTLLAPVIFFGTMPFGAGPSALPLLVPNRLRGQVVALYLLIANLIGQGGGPWIVAVFTDQIMKDPQLIRFSISTVCTFTAIAGSFVLYLGLKPYSNHITSIESKA